MNLLNIKLGVKFIPVAIMVLYSLSGFSQHAEFGLRFMPNFTSVNLRNSGGGTVTGEVTLGYGFGALLGFNFTNHVGIQGELIYNSLSQKYRENEVEHNIKLRYVNIPLLLSLNTGKQSLVSFNVVAGPQIGISVGSRLTSTGGDGTSTGKAVLSVKKGDLGFAYGAGLDFGIAAAGMLRLGLGFRGVIGLIDISDNSGSVTTNSYYILDRTHIKSYSGYVGVSYLF
ncbi:MAG: PorT family protein [Saprospiraceae bacterium]|nr:PorT family protein [Saprospiraceae bacterium]MBK8298423.1 PorT family protein [Saprospiraceae bacterium]